ncbi:ATP-binding protein [Poseidonocella sedimentorum]|uniref:histidine kinase n=1 Tax=Poseidonocella sedimentorum TaxID=871652 RepID=A0A1I6ELP0_9RHOB|nr:ATP-binding protein [Poseidonocella sedimentorum]SFR18693.1 two-component system, OmpR family, sensor histidine kinase ChvG [Poseidonocella sedimentorum]
MLTDQLIPEGLGAASAPPERSLWRESPLARRIVLFNLLAILLLVAGVLYVDHASDSLSRQRGRALVTEAGLIAALVDPARLDESTAAPALGAPADALRELALLNGLQVFLFDANAELRLRLGPDDAPDGNPQALAARAARFARNGATARTEVLEVSGDAGARYLMSGAPISDGGEIRGHVVVASARGEIEALAQTDRRRTTKIVVIAVLVSLGLSLALASTIAIPLADLAAAAERGRDENAGNLRAARIRIPDLTDRQDEIGRLSGALSGLVSGLFERIARNEQFASDVSHEIKNPLASLRSAASALRVAKPDQARELIEVIEQDVSRLDRLVSDISNASRLDSEMVREQEAPFDLVDLCAKIGEHMEGLADERGIRLTRDVPPAPLVMHGLEGRLAQVLVNLVSNAVSFCGPGDSVSIVVRRLGNRAVIMVGDTGPGIPEDAIQKIFERFFSSRPAGEFGKNSGLGLAISRQIVEAHGGTIHAENITATVHDPGSAPMGARFVVSLPV